MGVPRGTKGDRFKSRKSSFGSRARFAIFSNFCENVGALVGSWARPGGEATFVEQRFGPNPPKGQGVDRSSPQEGRLFGHPSDKKRKSENVGPLVGSSLAQPGGPGKLWRQSLLNKDLAQTPQRGRESTDPVPKRVYFTTTQATKKI